MKSLLLATAILIGLPAYAAPTVITEDVKLGNEIFNMNAAEYAILRVPKKYGVLIKAHVVDEYLATCNVLSINQGKDTNRADVIVSFEFENDGGYNSCKLELNNNGVKSVIELGTDAGE